jgi:CRISPR-associated protein Cas2
MRDRFLVAYDITDKDRLRQVHMVLMGFGDPLQYSVFDCRLSEKEVVLLITALSEIISPADDKVLLARLGPEGGRSSLGLKFLGRRDTAPERKPLVI